MKKLSILLILTLFFASYSFSQTQFSIVSYNVENLFDCENDSITNDDEYTPTGKRGWGYGKYKNKLARIAKTITAIGQGKPPIIIGLCEIENAKVLNDLVKYSPLKNFNYSFVHYDSPDRRGIDVGFLYQKNIFKPHFSQPIKVVFEQDPKGKTRDILHVAGTLLGKDTLHVFVCHFPSRLGGELESEHKRLNAASTLKNKVDSILSINEKANIVIMGDFNDYPDNNSLRMVLGATDPISDIDSKKLYNLFYQYLDNPNIGTHKYAGEWGVLDHILVSGNLLNSENRWSLTREDAKIFAPDFLLEDDSKNFGKKPFRTYIGYRYNDGFSDHLPIFIKITYQKDEF